MKICTRKLDANRVPTEKNLLSHRFQKAKRGEYDKKKRKLSSHSVFRKSENVLRFSYVCLVLRYQLSFIYQPYPDQCAGENLSVISN